MIAQAEHIPVHLGAMPEAVAAVRAREPAPGDVFVVNDPFTGGTHLPDITLVSRTDSGLRGHAGPLRRRRRRRAGEPSGHLDRPLPGGSRRPAGAAHGRGRDPPPRQHAQPGRAPRGPARPARGAPACGAPARRALRAPRDATRCPRRWTSSSPTPSDGFARRSPRSRTAATRRTTCSRRSRESSSSARPSPSPATRSRSTSPAQRRSTRATSTARSPSRVRRATSSSAASPTPTSLPRAARSRRSPLRRPRGLARQRAPARAAVVAGNVETSNRIADVLFRAFGQAVPVPAQGQGTMNNLTFGNARFTYYETIGGGQGACPESDGPSGVHVTMSNTLNTPVEALELAYPLRVERYALRLGSGGGAASGGRRCRPRDHGARALPRLDRERAPRPRAGGHARRRDRDRPGATSSTATRPRQRSPLALARRRLGDHRDARGRRLRRDGVQRGITRAWATHASRSGPSVAFERCSTLASLARRSPSGSPSASTSGIEPGGTLPSSTRSRATGWTSTWCSARARWLSPTVASTLRPHAYVLLDPSRCGRS